jgi:ABC-type dipeptide/oligopeptide/nickel transport system permease subunit
MPEQTSSPGMRALASAWRHWWFRAGCGLVAAVLLLAIYAPLLATEAALWWDGSPALADLFNRRSYPKPHDLLFNLVAVLLPFLAVGWFVLRHRLGAMARLRWCVAIPLVFWLLAMLPLWPREGGDRQAVWDDRPTTGRTIQAHRAGAAGFHVFAPIPHRWDATYAGAVLQPPGWVNPATGSSCILGTDPAGHDVAARLLFGARISLTIGLVATGIALLIGTIIGAISGFMGGGVDLLL